MIHRPPFPFYLSSKPEANRGSVHLYEDIGFYNGVFVPEGKDGVTAAASKGNFTIERCPAYQKTLSRVGKAHSAERYSAGYHIAECPAYNVVPNPNTIDAANVAEEGNKVVSPRETTPTYEIADLNNDLTIKNVTAV